MERSSNGDEAHIGGQLADLQELQQLPYLEAVKAYSGGRYNAVSVS